MTSHPGLATVPILQENVRGTVYFYPGGGGSGGGGTQATILHNNGPLPILLDITHPAQHGISLNPQRALPLGTLNNIPTPAHYVSDYVYNGRTVHASPTTTTTATLPPKSPESNYFMSKQLRSQVLERNAAANATLEPNERLRCELPAEVECYHSLYPLEPHEAAICKNGALPSSTYKATHKQNGLLFCLRRVHGFRLQSTKCMNVIETWKQIHHPNIARLREVFTTKIFGDNSLILVYDYHAGAQTLFEKYLTPPMALTAVNAWSETLQQEASYKNSSFGMCQSTRPGTQHLPEATIWSIIVQVTSALRVIHQKNLVCKNICPTKIIECGNRVRISFCGVTDFEQYDPNISKMAHLQMQQQEDLIALGGLILALCCRSLHALHQENFDAYLEVLKRNYSPDLTAVVMYLLTATQTVRTVGDLLPRFGARIFTYLDTLQTQHDVQEHELAKELENGRLYRILVKLNFINERPDHGLDNSWSETGDRYMLKLFRDYLFHAVDANNRPWLDNAHIVQNLNKLDAGSHDLIQLMSRDEQSVLIVSYAELKSCLQSAFNELEAQAEA